MADFGLNISAPGPRYFKANHEGTKIDPHTLSVNLEELGGDISEDSNTTLRVTNMVRDEFGNVTRIQGDNIFKGAVVTIPVEHHEIHCGDMYSLAYIEDLGNAAVLDMLIIVPNEGLPDEQPGLSQDIKQYHFDASVKVEQESTVEWFEGVTVSANGTAITSYNRNRNVNASDYSDQLDIFHGPTVTGTGTRLDVHKLGSGQKEGGEDNRIHEWVLRDNTLYLLRVTNNTANDNYIDVHINYYVHPGI